MSYPKSFALAQLHNSARILPSMTSLHVRIGPMGFLKSLPELPAVVLAQLLEDDRPRGSIDAHRKGLRAEQHLSNTDSLSDSISRYDERWRLCCRSILG